MSREQGTSQENHVTGYRTSVRLVLSVLVLTFHFPLSTFHSAEAAIGKSKDKQLAAGSLNQGGAVSSQAGLGIST